MPLWTYIIFIDEYVRPLICRWQSEFIHSPIVYSKPSIKMVSLILFMKYDTVHLQYPVIFQNPFSNLSTFHLSYVIFLSSFYGWVAWRMNFLCRREGEKIIRVIEDDGFKRCLSGINFSTRSNE